MLEFAAAANHSASFFYLGSIHEYGGDDALANFTRARLLYEVGCETHVSRANPCFAIASGRASGGGVVSIQTQ
jgi:TPR repeat protein